MATLALAGYRVVTKASEAHLKNQFGIIRAVGEPYLYWVFQARHIAWLEWEEMLTGLYGNMVDAEFSPALYTAIMDLDDARLMRFIEGGKYRNDQRPEF